MQGIHVIINLSDLNKPYHQWHCTHADVLLQEYI